MGSTDIPTCPFANLLDPSLIAEGIPEHEFAKVREAGPL
jgi:hypothetical protein